MTDIATQTALIPAGSTRPAWSRRRFLQAAGLAAGAGALGFPNLLQARGVNGRLDVGFVGIGGMGGSRLKEMLGCAANVVALCDTDDDHLATARRVAAGKGFRPKTFLDYRELLAQDLDAVVIATPDHWHAPVAVAALKAGKHVFCEKPLAHSVGEARELRTLAGQFPKLLTQMGNQGSASANLRRGIEVIQAGAIGAVREVHVWVAPSESFQAGQWNPTGSDPVPATLHWQNWIGPAAFHEYKKGLYHPKAWRAWYDFGGGSMADWGCHGLNLPVRALQLDYPTAIAADIPGDFTDGYPKQVRIRFDFAARNGQPPVTLWWYDGRRLPDAAALPKGLLAHFGEVPDSGVLILGEQGFTYGEPHTGSDYIQLAGEKKVSGILRHAATKAIAETLPRSAGHLAEWVNACGGGPATFSPFATGGFLTEIAQAGVVALRTRKPLAWDGPAMRATNAPEAEQFVRAKYRSEWTL